MEKKGEHMAKSIDKGSLSREEVVRGVWDLVDDLGHLRHRVSSLSIDFSPDDLF